MVRYLNMLFYFCPLGAGSPLKAPIPFVSVSLGGLDSPRFKTSPGRFTFVAWLNVQKGEGFTMDRGIVYADQILYGYFVVNNSFIIISVEFKFECCYHYFVIES